MDKECICRNPNKSLENIHYKKLNTEITLLKDNKGYGMIIFENDTAIGCFDINYCPICGRNLS